MNEDDELHAAVQRCVDTWNSCMTAFAWDFLEGRGFTVTPPPLISESGDRP